MHNHALPQQLLLCEDSMGKALMAQGQTEISPARGSVGGVQAQRAPTRWAPRSLATFMSAIEEFWRLLAPVVPMWQFSLWSVRRLTDCPVTSPPPHVYILSSVPNS